MTMRALVVSISLVLAAGPALAQQAAEDAVGAPTFQQGDVIVSFDGQTADMSTSQLLAYAAQETRPGQHIPVVVVRDGQRLELQLPMQE